MAQDTTPSIIVYQGTGSKSVFDVPFDKGYYGEVKVLFVRRGLADYTYYPSEDLYEVNGRLYAWSLGSDFVYTHTANPAVGAKTYDYRDIEQSATVSAIAGQTITVDGVTYNRSAQSDIANNMKLTWAGDMLQIGDFIAIIRDTERGQPYEYPNNQKHIERALDNLERQIQEVKDATDNALKVDPAHTIDPSKMSPIDWMETILRSVDKSVRTFRYLNGWLDYSLDDPNIADVDKTWTHLVNTDNIKAIREQSRIENNETIYYTEYLAQDGSWKTLSDPHKWDNMKLSDLTDTNINTPVNGQYLMFDGVKWKNVFSTVAMFWGDMQGDISDQTDLVAEFAKKVNKSGDTMTGDLSFQYNTNNPVLRIIQSGQNTNHLRFINNSYASQSVSFDLTQAAIHPLVTGRGHLGTSSIHFGDAYVDTIYTGAINNGYDISVPVTVAADSFALESEITDINGKIPAQASTSNQLADKSFVNSSIATNTADFKGTYNSLAELEAVTADNNDYGFVVSTDSAGNTVYARYKYNGASWVFEYNLNNSSFTANQWETINSGATSSDVSKARSAVQPADVGNGTITINQGGATKGTFTTNQGGNTTIELDAGSDGSYHPDLFDVKWSDHICNDASWLRADTFSWQDGTVYEAAYKHLCNDMYQWYGWVYNGTTIYTKKRYPEVGEKAYTSSALTTEFGTVTAIDSGFDGIGITVGGNHYDGITGASVARLTETIAGVTVQYIPAADGHKIVNDYYTSEVEAVYAATGVAWYYIVDPTNHRFKLPRTKFGFTGIRSGVGGYVEAGLPNITGITDSNRSTHGYSDGGAFYDTEIAHSWYGDNIHTNVNNLGFDASLSNSIYGNSTTVQPPATQMYLYFYVGSFTQTALENTAGLNAELFNNKVDIGHQVIAFQAPTAGNNYTWYRKYADGWVEQGGCQSASNTAINLPIAMADTYYTAIITANNASGISQAMAIQIAEKTATTLKAVSFNAGGYTVNWQISGLAA